MPSTRARTPLIRSLEPQLSRSRIEVDAGGGYEALLGLIMFAGHEPPGEYDAGPEWFEQVHDAASARLRAAVERLAGGVPTVFGHLLGLVRRAQAPRDLAALIDLVRRLPADELRLELLGSSSSAVRAGVRPTVLERAARGDDGAVAELLEVAADDARWAASLHAVLDLTPAQSRDLTVEVLGRWADEVFVDQQPGLVARITDQAERWRVSAGRLGWRAVVETATGGIVLDPDLPAERVLLVPTVLGSPWVYSTEVRGTKIFCCPVRDSSPSPGPQLASVLRALADDSRLTVLRHLTVNGPATLGDLTAVLAMSKSAVHKHVMLLRAAGLVGLQLGRDRRYTLRELPDLNTLVAEALRPDP